MDSNGYEDIGRATLAALRSRPKEKVIEAPSGLKYVIRRLDTDEILALQQGIPDIAGQPLTQEEIVAAARRASAVSPAEGFRRAQLFVAAALIAPEVGEGDGQIAVGDIPLADLTLLITEVQELAGMGKVAAAALRPTSGAADSLLH
jgi:hypothetical protein